MNEMGIVTWAKKSWERHPLMWITCLFFALVELLHPKGTIGGVVFSVTCLPIVMRGIAYRYCRDDFKD